MDGARPQPDKSRVGGVERGPGVRAGVRRHQVPHHRHLHDVHAEAAKLFEPGDDMVRRRVTPNSSSSIRIERSVVEASVRASRTPNAQSSAQAANAAAGSSARRAIARPW